MKRLLVLIVLSVTAVFLTTSLAAGQTGNAKSSTTSKVSPKRDKRKPYKFTTSGKVKPPKFCASTTPAANCVPLKCPPGATNPAYCTKPKPCRGKVRVRFKRNGKTVSSKTTNLKSNCKYKKKTTVKKKGRYQVQVRFLGNDVLAPSSASTKSVRAG